MRLPGSASARDKEGCQNHVSLVSPYSMAPIDNKLTVGSVSIWISGSGVGFNTPSVVVYRTSNSLG